MKNTNEVLRAQARNEFFSTSASLTDIADKVGVSRKTVSLWASGGNWHALKINSMRAPAILVDGMYAELSELAAAIAARPEGQRYPTPKEADIRRKTALTIKDLKKGISTPEKHELLKAFSAYIGRANKYTAQLMSRYITDFLNEEDVLGYHPHQVEYRAKHNYENPLPEPELTEAPLHDTEPILISTDLYTESDHVIDDVIIPEPGYEEEYLDIACLQEEGYELTSEQAQVIEYYKLRQRCYWRQASRLNRTTIAIDIRDNNINKVRKYIKERKELCYWKQLIPTSAAA